MFAANVHIAQPMPVRPLHTKEAAEWLGTSTKSLLELARTGMIGKKIGGTWYFSPQALCELVDIPFDPKDFQN